MKHHALGPSALKYVELCPGYRGEVGETNIFAEEGTLLHEACETEVFDGLDDEQTRAVARCLDYRDKLAEGADEVLLETRYVIRYES